MFKVIYGKGRNPLIVLELLDALLFRELADQQRIVVLSDDISVESLQDHLLLLGCVHNAVAALKGVDVLADESVAVHVALALQQQRAPCAEVAPAEVCREDEDLLGILHHGIVDGNVVAVGIHLINSLLLLWRAHDILYALKDIVDARRIDTQGIDDGLDAPHKDAGIPEEVMLTDIVLGGLQVRLFLELVDTIDLAVAR